MYVYALGLFLRVDSLAVYAVLIWRECLTDGQDPIASGRLKTINQNDI